MNPARLRHSLWCLLFLLTRHAVAETTLLPLPDKEGFAGVFAGVSHAALLVAGGANFPDRKPWEGGTKLWHDKVWVLDSKDSSGKTAKWKVAGQLPRPLAYGVSATYGDAVLAIGGADGKEHRIEAMSLRWNGEQLATEQLPKLPQPLAYGCGALIGSKLYLSGGQTSPDSPPVKLLYRIDLASTKPKWETLPDCPGPGRMLAVAAVQAESLVVIGGVELVKDAQGQLQRRYLDSVYRYDDQRGWQELTPLPRALAAAPSPAPKTERGFLVLGGDDGLQIGQDPKTHRGFSAEILEYDTAKNRWSAYGKISSPRVTTPFVLWQDLQVVPSGEIAPGRRTPEILILDFSGNSAGQR
jgi:N-acetylneuraminate epimerase